MKKTAFTLGTIVFCLLVIISSCTKQGDHTATISANFDSKYVNTFEDLGLGILYDFELSLPDADKRWVNIWVEDYIDGKMESNPIAELSWIKPRANNRRSCRIWHLES